MSISSLIRGFIALALMVAIALGVRTAWAYAHAGPTPLPPKTLDSCAFPHGGTVDVATYAAPNGSLLILRERGSGYICTQFVPNAVTKPTPSPSPKPSTKP